MDNQAYNPSGSATAQGSTFVNQGVNPGVIQIRLDTSQIMIDFADSLRGEQVVAFYDTKTRTTDYKRVKVGERLVNEAGIQSLTMFLRKIVSSHGVQGNWTPVYFENFICYTKIIANIIKILLSCSARMSSCNRNKCERY
jgi:hypothetical protein